MSQKSDTFRYRKYEIEYRILDKYEWETRIKAIPVGDKVILEAKYFNTLMDLIGNYYYVETRVEEIIVETVECPFVKLCRFGYRNDNCIGSFKHCLRYQKMVEIIRRQIREERRKKLLD